MTFNDEKLCKRCGNPGRPASCVHCWGNDLFRENVDKVERIVEPPKYVSLFDTTANSLSAVMPVARRHVNHEFDPVFSSLLRCIEYQREMILLLNARVKALEGKE